MVVLHTYIGIQPDLKYMALMYLLGVLERETSTLNGITEPTYFFLPFRSVMQGIFWLGQASPFLELMLMNTWLGIAMVRKSLNILACSFISQACLMIYVELTCLLFNCMEY